MEAEELERAYRAEATVLRATLARRLGDVGLAEELVQDAFVEALEHWQSDGVPPNPGGWLTTTAWRKALDRQRRVKAGREKLALLAVTQDRSGPARRPWASLSQRSTTTCSASSLPAAIRRCRLILRSR